MNGIDTSTLLIMAGVVLLTFSLIRILRRRAEQTETKLKPTSYSDPTPSSIKPRQVADSLEVQLYNTFRELNARLDTKFHLLNELVVEAERKATRLEKLMASPSITLDGEDTIIIATDKTPSPTETSRFDEIHALAERGMTPPEIAQRVDLPIGEINLILSLRRRRKTG